MQTDSGDLRLVEQDERDERDEQAGDERDDAIDEAEYHTLFDG